MEIRKLETEDIERTVEIWYEASVIAHHFISSTYWEKNKEAMASVYLPNAETYVAVDHEKVVGFIAMTGNHLAAVFVDVDIQGKGIGKTLLDFIKEKRSAIQLKVFKENAKSVAFYKKQHFKVISETTDEDTGELEWLMEWKINQ